MSRRGIGVSKHKDVNRGVNILVEHRDGTGDANDDQWLTSHDGKYNSAQNRGQEDFVYAILHVCFTEHVQREGECGEDTVHEHKALVQLTLHTATRGYGYNTKTDTMS